MAEREGEEINDEDQDKKTYVEEQEDLKKAFLNAFDDEVGATAPKEKSEFGGVLSKSTTRRKEAEIEDEETEKLVDSLFNNRSGQVSEEDNFLRNYILKKAWEKEDEYSDGDDNGLNDVEEDEAALNAAEEFEASYNFRFEEPGGAEIVTHPRIVEGIVRKTDDRRKQKRAEKAARKAQEEEERRIEIKRLKNLKKGEIEEKLRDVKTIAGTGAPDEELLGKLLGGDFDPEEHDKAMATAFGDDYYEEEDAEDIEDQLFDKQLEAMAQYSSDDDLAENTFSAVLDRTKKSKSDPSDDGASASTSAKEDVKKLMEEYYKLDYEDYVGGIATRFRYKQVKPETYGLTIEEILGLEDKDLNQVIGMKRVAAPYHDGPKFRPNYGKLNEFRRERRLPPNKSESRKGQTNGSNHWDMKSLTENDFEVKNAKSKEDIEKERRLETFKKPSLKRPKRDEDKDEGRKRKKPSSSKQLQDQRQRDDQHAGLTKAQKRNLKRSKRRSSKVKLT